MKWNLIHFHFKWNTYSMNSFHSFCQLDFRFVSHEQKQAAARRHEWCHRVQITNQWRLYKSLNATQNIKVHLLEYYSEIQVSGTWYTFFGKSTTSAPLHLSSKPVSVELLLKTSTLNMWRSYRPWKLNYPTVYKVVKWAQPWMSAAVKCNMHINAAEILI